MDNEDKQDIANLVVDKLMLSSFTTQGPDFTVKDLMKLFNISKNIASSCTVGRYKMGGSVRFRREDILYYRKMGLHIKKK
ncbi:hypothetical protein ACFL5S_01130 [Fibrobacterota bacterium]